MVTEEWRIEARLQGDFRIGHDNRTCPPLASLSGLRRLEIEPLFNPDGQWTGQHTMAATVVLDNDTDGPLPGHVVYDRARDLVDSMLAAISLEVGRVIRVVGAPSAKHKPPSQPARTRVIMGPSKVAKIAPPAMLKGDLLALELDPKVRRTIRWWARGVAARDPVDGLLALNNALDLLAGMYEQAPGRIRRCPDCGREERIGPGLRERVVAFLTDRLGYQEAKATAVYESRLDLAHARSNLGPEEVRVYLGQCSVVATAVRDGLADRLGVRLPEMPAELPVSPETAILDLTLDEPEVPQPGSDCGGQRQTHGDS